jgi:hypothetical protein
MKKWKTTLCLLALWHLIMYGDAAAACNVVNRFVGKGIGVVLPAEFTYDVTVKAGTIKNVLNSTIFPVIEKAFATKSAPTLIVACAPAV